MTSEYVPARAARLVMRLAAKAVLTSAILLSCWTGITLAQDEKAAPGPATLSVQEMVAAAKQYSDEKAPGLSDTERTRRKETREKISGILDLHEMARLILAGNWGKQKPSDREKYAALLTALVEKIGYPQIERLFNGNLEIAYTGEKSSETGKTSVFTSILYKDEDVKLTTEFRLYLTEKGWRIYDVITDGESLLLIYRNQHAGIIKEKGFPQLIKLMEKKLNEGK